MNTASSPIICKTCARLQRVCPAAGSVHFGQHVIVPPNNLFGAHTKTIGATTHVMQTLPASCGIKARRHMTQGFFVPTINYHDGPAAAMCTNGRKTTSRTSRESRRAFPAACRKLLSFITSMYGSMGCTHGHPRKSNTPLSMSFVNFSMYES